MPSERSHDVPGSTEVGGGPSPVEVAGVVKHYGAKEALGGISLSVEPGEFVVLLGPSGSGKTTLLRCIAGIERITSGSIHIAGEQVAGRDVHVPPERRGLAMVFQDYALWPHMTAARNVEFALRRHSLVRAEARRRVDTLLEHVGLLHLRDRYPNELSGGEQQRVALARALVAQVGLVLFDEPLSNLDADRREQLRIEIATLTRDSGATSVYITHDQAEAFALADRVGVLREGRLVQVGAPEEIYRRPVDAFVARFTGVAGELPANVTGAATGEPGSVAPPSVRPFGSPLAPVRLACGGAEVLVSLPAGVPDGGSGSVFIRPSGARLVGPDQPADLRAEILDVAFCGRGYEHAAVVADGPLLTKVFSERRFARGSNVGIVLDPEACVLLSGQPRSEGVGPDRSERPDREGPRVRGSRPSGRLVEERMS